MLNFRRHSQMAARRFSVLSVTVTGKRDRYIYTPWQQNVKLTQKE